MYYNLVGKAFMVASFAHSKQMRKWESNPYIVHLCRVANICREHIIELYKGGVIQTEIMCAALLHDTLEDTDYSEQSLDAEFGSDICDLVKQLTNPSCKFDIKCSREIKKAADFEHISKASLVAKQIKLADRLDNISYVGLTPYSYALKYLKETRQLVDIIGDAHHVLRDKILEICRQNT